jgi:hypothetical protein
MMRRAVVLAAGALLAACGPGNVLSKGEIIEKRYDNPDTWTSFYCGSMNYQTGACLIWLPQTIHDSAHYWLDIRGQDDKGKWHRELHETDRATYQEAEVGLFWDAGTIRCCP